MQKLPGTLPGSFCMLIHLIHYFTKKKRLTTVSLSAPQVGLEPTTLRLTAECSAIELLRNMKMRQRPTLPGRLQPSTIGVLRLNFCVRNGNRWNPQAITTAMGELIHFRACSSTLTTVYEPRSIFAISYWSFWMGVLPPNQLESSYRPISIIKLHALLHFHR